VFLNFDEHLRTNPNSEIIGELNRINVVLQDFITDIEAQDLRRTEQSVQQSVLLVLPNFLTLSPTSSTLVASYFSRTSSTDCCTDCSVLLKS
jgi:hypothetical protein